MSTTPGWCSVASIRASARNLAPKDASADWSARKIFTATVRPSTSSVARQTSPMPPVAIRSSSR
jgi:hypothetical protein